VGTLRGFDSRRLHNAVVKPSALREAAKGEIQEVNESGQIS
jgi:hypothetical protein